MRTIEADLDMRNRTTNWEIPLGSVNTLKRLQRGEMVRLEDDQMEVEAVVEIRNGLVVAQAHWDTLAYRTLDRARFNREERNDEAQH